MTNRQYRRRRVTAQSTWKKSVASIVDAWACRNVRQLASVCRFGAGGIFRGLENPADRGRADPVAELEQLTLDPLVSPAAVLGREPLDQRGDLGADRRPSRPVRIAPLAGDQAAVPAQDGAGGDQPVHPKLCWQEPDQHGEDRAVGPVEPGAADWRGAARRPRAAARAARRSWRPMTGRA